MNPYKNNQSSQILIINSAQVNLQDRNKSININILQPNITQDFTNQNINNINPLNFNNINNSNLIQRINQNIIPGIQQNNNILQVINYLIPIQSQLI